MSKSYWILILFYSGVGIRAAQADVILSDQTKTHQYTFKEYHHLSLSPLEKHTEEEAYENVAAALKKVKKSYAKELQGNPASNFCTKLVLGQSLNLYDDTQNEYAICKLKSGDLVDAWDLLRAKK